jgi:Raf kinase inhibitor-like YbhB/YbcL family protein
MRIISTALEQNRNIPELYTCDGNDKNPPLRFEDIPNNAASLALIVSDPDAVGKKPFYHWVVFNIDPRTDQIEEDTLPATGIEGRNDFGKVEYGGPCPPSGTHHYIFTLYALDSSLHLEKGATAEEVIKATKGHTIETAELVGLYSRKRM